MPSSFGMKDKVNPFLNILIYLMVAFCSSSAFAQGGWDIDYLPIDSINQSFIGKDIRVDFKSSSEDKLQPTQSVRWLLLKKDTVTLYLSSEKSQFVEDWKLYVDNGAVADQTLRSVANRNKKGIMVREELVKAVDELTVTLEMHLYDLKSPLTLLEKQNVVIEKSRIKGFLIGLE